VKAAVRAKVRIPGSPHLEPTPEQVAVYARDGFVVVPEFLAPEEVERVLGRFARVFAHEWETGIAPDEVNYTPGLTPPERTRQLCNVWKSDRTIASVTLSPRSAAFAAGLTGATGLRINQDNLIWKPASGRPLLAHQDGSYLDYLDPPNMVTCWIALDDTSAEAGTIYYARGSHRWPHATSGGQFHAPDDWLAWLERSRPASAQLDLVPVEVPCGGAAFHDAWTFHGSPANSRRDTERRSIISHFIDAGTHWNPAHPHPVYSRYRRPGETELDEAFFPVVWRNDGTRTGFLDDYLEPAERTATSGIR
jgi:ectoine hydroxylase-related dioxygenase (phytanoyl-CoA dioxygenase family)